MGALVFRLQLATVAVANSCSSADKLPDAAAPLSDLDLTGGWTLMNPVYTPGELETVEVVGRPPVTLADKAAHGSVKLLR